MRFPCEFISSLFLPGLRIRITHLLRYEGLSQNEIAKKLGVKQPVVVSYLQKQVEETGDERINHHLEALSEQVVLMLMNNESIDVIMRSICNKCKSLRVSGPICSIHKEILPDIQHIKNCNICMGSRDLPSMEKRSIILQSLEDVLATLKEHSIFLKWIPQIGSQLACCDSEAQEYDDVASFPGRIIRVKDTITNVHPPEFGSSKTSSSLLLWFKKNRPDVRWILSIKTKSELKKIFKKKKVDFLTTEHLDLATKKVLKRLEREKGLMGIQALIDEASPGYESITYLFAKDENDLLNLVNLLK